MMARRKKGKSNSGHAGKKRWGLLQTPLTHPIAVLFFGRERRFSREAFKNFATSMGWIALNWCMAPFIYIAMKFTRRLYGQLSIPDLPASFWQDVPWVVVLFISILTKDFADYWNHRLMHMRWIWPIHAVHHSDTHVNFLTSFRIHFLESIFMGISYVILLSWLGISPLMGALGSMIFTLHNCYVHIDADIGHGPFKYILTSPRLHRWHHADHPDAYGKNLANLFPFYDLLFGTYYLPGRCNKIMGARSEDISPFNIASQFALPFTRWLKMSADSAKYVASWAFTSRRPR